MAYAVPNSPGVPVLLGGFAPTNALTMIAGEVLNFLLPFSVAPQWGIFLGGEAIITADSVIAIDYKQEWVIADYPIEGGGFESYDKVWRPFDVRFRFSAGGNEANRQALIASIAAIAGDLNLYDFVSPEAIYESVSISHYDYHRTAQNGAGLLQVDVWGWQIMLNGGSGLSNTASAASADQTSTGPSQAGTPSTAQTGSATTSLSAQPTGGP